MVGDYLLYVSFVLSSIEIPSEGGEGADHSAGHLSVCPRLVIWAASWRSQQNNYAPSEDSDQPGHLPSLIWVFAVRFIGSEGPTLSSCGQRRPWLDWTDAQADLSLRWAHMPLCWFCHEVAHFTFYYSSSCYQRLDCGTPWRFTNYRCIAIGSSKIASYTSKGCKKPATILLTVSNYKYTDLQK